MHLSLDLCLLVVRRLVSADQIACRAHEHLLAICPICREEHAVDQGAAREEGGEPDAQYCCGTRPEAQPLPPFPADRRHLGEADLKPRLALLKRIQRLRDLDRRHLAHLMTFQPADWIAEVESARSRYRSRSFAERLIEESRQQVRRQPEVARKLASLVPVVIRWIPESGGKAWAADLKTRAAAWEANALRVAGDLEAAQRRFETLDVERLLSLESWTAGEVASLLASLRIDQRHVDEAARLLRQARAIFLHHGDTDSAVRGLIKEGNLYSDASKPSKALALYDQAAELLEGRSAPESLLSAVQVGRIVTLCDLERHEEASELLESNLPLPWFQDPHLRSILRYNRGRIAIGLERYREAVSDLASARDQFLETGRTFDAVLASLDLAYAYLQAGRTAEARDLAGELVPQFQSRSVAREALAALTVLADAVQAENVTRDLLARVRRQVSTGSRTPRGSTGGSA